MGPMPRADLVALVESGLVGPDTALFDAGGLPLGPLSQQPDLVEALGHVPASANQEAAPIRVVAAESDEDRPAPPEAPEDIETCDRPEFHSTTLPNARVVEGDVVRFDAAEPVTEPGREVRPEGKADSADLLHEPVIAAPSRPASADDTVVQRPQPLPEDLGYADEPTRLEPRPKVDAECASGDEESAVAHSVTIEFPVMPEAAAQEGSSSESIAAAFVPDFDPWADGMLAEPVPDEATADAIDAKPSAEASTAEPPEAPDAEPVPQPELSGVKPKADEPSGVAAEWVDGDVFSSIDIDPVDIYGIRLRIARCLKNNDYAMAEVELDRLILEQPKNRWALVARAYCRFELSGDHATRVAQCEFAHEEISNSDVTLWSLVYATRMQLGLDRLRVAEDLYDTIAAREWDDPDALEAARVLEHDLRMLREEIRQARANAEDAPAKANPKAESLVFGRPAVGGSAWIEGKSPLARPVVAGAAVVLLAGLLSAMAGSIGRAEAVYELGNGFFWVRRLFLLGVGAVAAYLAFGSQILAGARWKASGPGLLFAVAMGLGVGLVSPSQPVAAGAVGLVLMASAHVLAEEVFFRLYVDAALVQTKSPLAAASISGALFGLYHLSYGHMQVGVSFWVALQWAALIAVGAGVPLSLLFHKTRSFLPPLIAHLVLNIVMILGSSGS